MEIDAPHLKHLTDDARNRIWNSRYDVRGSLYLLGREANTALSRNDRERTDYGNSIRRANFFSKKNIEETHKDLVLSKIDSKLKPAVYAWMEKYTSSEESALSVANFAMSLMIQLKARIVLEKFHTEKTKKYGAVKKSFQELFHKSQFENVLDLMLDMLLVHNQGVNAKTQENKQLANNASTDVQKNTDIESNMGNEKDEMGNAKDGTAGLSTDESKINEFDEPHKNTDGNAKKESDDINDDGNDQHNVLLAIVQAIPEEHVHQCFEIDYESFLSMLNIVCLKNVKHMCPQKYGWQI
jgi:hypothetical protein